MAHFVGVGNVYPAPEWRDCCWPGCMRMAEGGGPPLCQRHVDQIVMEHEATNLRRTAAEIAAARVEREREYELHQAMRAQALEEQSKVYYVRIGDHVKIGFTINLRQRLGALRVSDDALLAAEPGGRIKERERHQQFAAERVGRRENFNPSRRLIAHIAAIRAEHGEPSITTYPRASLDRG